MLVLEVFFLYWKILLEQKKHRIFFPSKFFRPCLVPQKFKGKCEEKKIRRKSGRKKIVKENKK